MSRLEVGKQIADALFDLITGKKTSINTKELIAEIYGEHDLFAEQSFNVRYSIVVKEYDYKFKRAKGLITLIEL